MEKTRKLKKVDKDSFEVTNTETRVVDKKQLVKDIEEIREKIAEKKRVTGITLLEQTLEQLQSLLDEANKLK